MMESNRNNCVGLRTGPGGKKMRKRKELDALVGGVGGSKRSNGGAKRAGSGGVSPQDQLLSESTGEEEYWSSKGGKGRQRYISNENTRASKSCTSLLKVCTILLVMACLVATLTVMWLFIDVREQTSYLHNQLDQVAAGSQGASDALQKCHSLSRQLQSNQTLLFSKVNALTQSLANYTTKINLVQNGLTVVEEKLKATPELVNVPKDLQALSGSVATFGSQIGDLQSQASEIRDEHNKLTQKCSEIGANFTKLASSVEKMGKLFGKVEDMPQLTEINVTKRMDALKNDMKANLSALSLNISWVSDDQHRDHKVLEQLQEIIANLSSRLTTLQDASSSQVTNNELITNAYRNMSSEINKIHEKVAALDQEYLRLKNLTQYLAMPSSQIGSGRLESDPQLPPGDVSTEKVLSIV